MIKRMHIEDLNTMLAHTVYLINIILLVVVVLLLYHFFT